MQSEALVELLLPVSPAFWTACWPGAQMLKTTNSAQLLSDGPCMGCCVFHLHLCPPTAFLQASDSPSYLTLHVLVPAIDGSGTALTSTRWYIAF